MGTITWLERTQWGGGPIRAGIGVPHENFTRLVVHHTTSPFYGDPVDYMRRLQVARSDLGSEVPYSFVVMPGATDDDAVIGVGRGWARSGAHTVDYNQTAYGIALAGDFTEHAPTPGMLAAIRLIGSYLRDPLPTLGHRDVYATACPGALAYPLIEQLQPPFWTADPSTEDDDMQLTDQLTKHGNVNDVLIWTIEGINKANAAIAALAAQVDALIAHQADQHLTTAGVPAPSADEIIDKLKERL